MRCFAPAALIALTLAGCTQPPPRTAPPIPTPTRAPLPQPRPAPTPAPLAADWRDWPFTPGDWRYVKSAGSSYASFGGGGQVLALTCNQSARQIDLSGVAVGSPVTIRTTTATRVLNPRSGGGDPPIAIVTLPAADTLFDAIAFSRGRFVVEQAGKPPMVLPPYAEIGRVIEDCRG
ncbi:MAG: hypothetical protein V4459_12770 [Pseudomonadota bacterium]